MTDSIIDVMARAMKADWGRQMDAKPLPGPNEDPEDWSATGSIVDLAVVSESQVEALEKAGYAIVPVEPTDEMTNVARHELRNIDKWQAMVAARPKETAD
jgi:hypothetical protein